MEEEQHLIEQAQAGDRNAFEKLVIPIHDDLYRYIYRLCNSDKNLAEDLLQESLMIALTNLSMFEGKSRFKTWLTSIAANLYRQKIRRLVMRRNLIQKLLPSTTLVTQEINENEICINKNAVNRLLKRLPEGQRHALYLREILGYSISEISEILGIKENAVKNRLHNGRQKLISIVKHNNE